MKKKILVVDDEMSICLLLENFLSEQYDVVYKNEGAAALEHEAHLRQLGAERIGKQGGVGFKDIIAGDPAPERRRRRKIAQREGRRLHNLFAIPVCGRFPVSRLYRCAGAG